MRIALLGNPNTGKSSVFNMLTGLRQHIGNFPGVTVDKKFGIFSIEKEEHTLIDFPGTYSIYPRSKDEQVVYDVLSNPGHADFPDLVMVVADESNLERNLFLFTQIYDLKIPSILVLNMADIARKKGKVFDIEKLQKRFSGSIVVETTARIGIGKDRLIQAVQSSSKNTEYPTFLENSNLCELGDLKGQESEANDRYLLIRKLIEEVEVEKVQKKESQSNRIDKILVHPIFGYLIFAGILMLIFQFIFAFAAYPMDFIDGVFANFSGWLGETLPKGLFSDLLSQGIVPGIGGVIVFIPQIALLFFFISILEESGYLARVVFIMDRLMRPLGLSGKSVVPLMSSVACAIPGVMATRTISDWKERMITILVAPLMSCSARIPVYTLLIALVIPNEKVFGFINLQGLVLFGLYSLGLISALVIAAILKMLINSKEKGFLLLELPSYKAPRWGNVGITVWEKVKVFTLSAGKIILAISILLWAMATFGPSNTMEQAGNKAKIEAESLKLGTEEKDRLIASAKLEQSYIGILGKTIEPVIEPLGYDWKIGISLITSFAAREVFVGSLATIYAVQEDGGTNKRLIERLRDEKRSDGKPVYDLASGVSLMIFYVFAMQCMATLAVVKRETKSWKWPLIQMGFMAILAYACAWIAFQLLS
ncbi:MAG: ferrous iron transport protein [Bacteroidota bacterium]|jgi:ferrous iron transport protein B